MGNTDPALHRTRSRAAGPPPVRLGRLRWVAAACGLAAFAIGRLLAGHPGWVETYYARGIVPATTSWLSRLSGAVPFSIAEWAVLALLLRWLLGGGRGLYRLLRSRKHIGRTILAGFGSLAGDLGVVVTLFYLLWGFNYARAPLGTRLGWGNIRQPSSMEIRALAEELAEESNTAYLSLHGKHDLGAPTPRPADLAGLDIAADAAWQSVLIPLQAPGPSNRVYGRAKPLLLGRLASYLGLGGYFFPFTAEANVNADVPAVLLPQALAHEKAHQRGLAREDEANFAGYVVGSASADPLARYSACLFAQRQLVEALRRSDRDAARAIAARRLPGVKRDLDDVAAYGAAFRGPMSAVGELVNDWFLRSNRVQGGTLSYGRSVLLIVQYARAHGRSVK